MIWDAFDPLWNRMLTLDEDHLKTPANKSV